MAKNVILLNKGDSYSFEVGIVNETYPDKLYFLTENDIVYFGLMYPHSDFEDACLLKMYTKKDMDNCGVITVKIHPNDTKDLPVGVYYYTVKLQQNIDPKTEACDLSKGKISTVIQRTKFIIME